MYFVFTLKQTLKDSDRNLLLNLNMKTPSSILKKNRHLI